MGVYYKYRSILTCDGGRRSCSGWWLASNCKPSTPNRTISNQHTMQTEQHTSAPVQALGIGPTKFWSQISSIPGPIHTKTFGLIHSLHYHIRPMYWVYVEMKWACTDARFWTLTKKWVRMGVYVVMPFTTEVSMEKVAIEQHSKWVRSISQAMKKLDASHLHNYIWLTNWACNELELFRVSTSAISVT